MVAQSQFTPLVDRMGCLRGISHWHRFTGNTIGAFLGLVPSERSSGQTRSLGGITKTGNSHARRLLIEVAWQHRREYRDSTPDLGNADSSTMLGRRVFKGWLGRITRISFVGAQKSSASMWSDPFFRFEQHETTPRATPDCKSCGAASERPLHKKHYRSAVRRR